ncbi:MAG: radical SAM protein, partial [Candidatus Methylomirabilis sp.]|nr:radical SAM protein [Deltaproteobacteria bacterium]
MRIALVACPAWANWAPNPALLLLRAQLKREGHAVRIWDLNIETYRAVSEKYRPWWLDENSIKWETAEEVEALFRDHADFFEAKAAELAAFAPGLVGFSLNSGARYTSPLMARIVRRRVGATPIVFGGADCFRSEQFTSYMIPGVVDAVCSGEGDFVLPELARAVETTGRIPPDQGGFCVWENGAVRDNGEPRRPEDLDVLAPIDIEDVDLRAYALRNRVTMSISRGCVKRCAFCSEGPNFFQFRTHTAEWMIAQLESLLPAIQAQSGQVPHINFNDSLINGNVEVMDRMCDAILAKGLKFTWGGMAIIRAEMTREFLVKMRRAGCVEICWGIESGSTRILKKMGKGVTVSLMDQVVRTAAAVGIMQYGNIIVGFPGERPAQFAESMLFATKNRRYFGCLGLPIYTPAKNSTVFKSPHLFGMANLDPREWRTEDEVNTPAVRVLRRDILSMILADKKFEQGRYAALESKYAVDLQNAEQRAQ